MKKSKLFYYGIIFMVFIFTQCIFVSTKVYKIEKDEIEKSKQFEIESSTKAHLYNGSMITFPDGFTVISDTIKGEGTLYDLTRQDSTHIKKIPLDSVACLEHYKKNWHAGAFFTSLPAVIGGSVFLFKALFGSCPTVYSNNGSKYSLESECFSYAISERFEGSDLDRLDFGGIKEGKYKLKISNEALETHYINHLSLLTVEHSEKYEPFPAENQGILLLGANVDFSAKSRSGKDITNLISEKDSCWYQSDSTMLTKLSQEITQDWIDITVKTPRESENIYMAFRFRNTLLNTVLLYDVMLKSKGIKAIDWLANETSNIFYAWRLNEWYKEHFGLHVQIFNGDEYEEIIRIGDTGPIAWHVEAAEITTVEDSSARIRVSFLPDNCVIDWIGISFENSTDYNIHEMECNRITDNSGNLKNNLIERFDNSDDKYMITYPGESYFLDFDIPPNLDEERSSFFLKSKGFYIEWLRNDWFGDDLTKENNVSFELNDETILKTAKLWLEKKNQFEKKFYESKILKN